MFISPGLVGDWRSRSGIRKNQPLAAGGTTQEEWLPLQSSLGDQVEVAPRGLWLSSPLLWLSPCLVSFCFLLLDPRPPTGSISIT